MTREERIEKLRQACDNVQLEAFRYLRTIMGCDIRTCGYSSYEDLLRKVINRCDKDCEKLMKPFDRGDLDV